MQDWEDGEDLEGLNFEFVIEDFKPIRSSVKGMKISSFVVGGREEESTFWK